MDIKLKVQQLKSSFTVEGVPLVKSNRFDDSEIAEMKKSSTAHVSHWYGVMPKSKTWTDEEIATQIEVFLETPTMNKVKFKSVVEKMLKALPINDKAAERKAFRELLFGILGWTEERNGISEMWRSFGSAPSGSLKGCNNKKLDEAARKYGAVGMDVIFDGQFSDKFHIFWYGANNALQGFEAYWDEEKRKKDLKAQKFESPYKDLDDIEENVVMKKIPEAAKQYYMDKSKPFDERVKVFSKHGESDSSIFEPTDPDLKKIFDIYQEGGWLERHQMIESADVVWSWMDNLKNDRCHLDWTNPYHPKLKTKKRNYKPSAQAIQRLYRFYMEKLFLDGIGSFEFDW